MSVSGILIVLVALVVLVVLGMIWRTRNLAAGAEALVPRAGQIQAVPGGAIHYVEMGPEGAPTLVLIHGLSGQLQHLTYALAGLLAEEFRVIALDRPGCGYSSRDSGDLATVSEQGRMIGAFLDAKGVDRPVLVGHSLGGALALAMALDRPDKTGALALLAPATHPIAEAPPVFRGLAVQSPLVRRVLGQTIAVPLAKATGEKVVTEVFAPDRPPADFLTRGGAVLGLRPQSFVSASEDYVALNRVLPEQAARYADGLRVPGGVLYGAGDALLSPQAQGASMQAFGLEYEELPGHGHMIPITAPEDCAAFVRRMAAKRTV